MASDVLSRIYNDDNFSDVVVKCGDLERRAHKNVLAAHSDVLRTVFSSNNFVEGRTGVYEIKEADMSPAILHDVLQWMYLHEIPHAADKVDELLDAAEYFQMAALQQMCAKLLGRKLSVDNCLQLLDVAFKYEVKELIFRQFCNATVF